ncbi:MAG: hypothetical protein PVI86_01595 [Phycisphaerae bacterium]|jgi:hypothetical protein
MEQNYHDSFISVQIHIGDDYSYPWGEDRADFYSVGGTPDAWFDGIQEASGAYQDIGQQYNWYRSIYNQRVVRPTDVTIDITGGVVAEEVAQVQADVCIEAGGSGKTLIVHVVQVLDYWPSGVVDYSRNGFKQAADPEVIVLSPGECQSIQTCFEFDRDSWLDQQNIKIVAWAQDPGPGPQEVHQAAFMEWPFPGVEGSACCLPDGTCTDADHNVCVAAGGDPLGPGSNCCDGSCHDMKWVQPPLLNPASPEPICFWGWDEPSTYDCTAPGCQIVADDYECTDLRPISDIHWWGSYLGWQSADPPPLADPGAPDYFHVGIWTDVPAGVDGPFSHPGQLIQDWTVSRASLNERNVGCDFHPDFPGPDTCFRYDFTIPQEHWYLQESADPTIYWLSVSAHYPDGEPTIPWGWKTREHFFNDSAVRITDPNNPTAPDAVYVAGTPIEHPEQVGWDMAFTLGTFCPVVDPPAPEDDPGVIPKNRYISFVPGNPGQMAALRVTLRDLPPLYTAAEGCQLWVTEPFEVSEASANPEGPPPYFMAANLENTDTPHCMDWSTVGLVHVFDSEIVPGALYEVQAVNCWCDTSSEGNFSDPLAIATSDWGDVVGNGYGVIYPDVWDPPQGVVDFNDITALVDKFKNEPDACKKARTDLCSDNPDMKIDFVDIGFCVEAFRGFGYSFDGPDECP